MDYEKKYKSLVEAVKTLKEANQSDEGIQNWVKNNVPELQESENEEIRKEILSALKFANHKGIYDKHIAWLEKQKSKILPKFKIGEVIRFKGNDTLKGEEETHKIVAYDNELYVFDDGTTDLFSEQELYEAVEQKPSDKIEPKFKVGDWVMLDRPVLITKVEDMPYNTHQYWTSDGTWFGDATKSKLWTIQDAKDGDVLCYKDEISLYMHDIKNCTKQETIFGGFVYYCCYDGKRFITNSLYSLTEQNKIDIHPTTKEQRELLFQKIKEAGYQWDAEKKELKKIEQNHVEWSEEDEEKLHKLIHNLEYNENFDKNDVILWLKSIRPKNMWKPSEEQMDSLLFAEGFVRGHCAKEIAKELNSLYEQLKTLL